MSPNGYQKAKLEDVQSDIKEIKDEMCLLRKDVADIKISLSFWKGGAAVLGALGGFLMSILLKFIKFN